MLDTCPARPSCAAPREAHRGLPKESEGDNDVLVLYAAAVVHAPQRSVPAGRSSSTPSSGAEVVVGAGLSRRAVNVQIISCPPLGGGGASRRVDLMAVHVEG